MKLPSPKKEAILYDDKKLYITLANYPITKGHTVVVWKKKTSDLHLLSKKDYAYLMNKVDETRDALLKTLKIKKVYLVYADEVNQVHWHLVPRYNEKGFNLLTHKPSILKDFSLVSKIKEKMKKK